MMVNDELENIPEGSYSGIREFARGYVGAFIRQDKTQNGRLRLRFDVACGKVDESKRKLATWRHCVAYDDIANSLKDIQKGSFVKVMGWVTTESNDNSNGSMGHKEWLILFSGEIIPRENISNERQLALTAGK